MGQDGLPFAGDAGARMGGAAAQETAAVRTAVCGGLLGCPLGSPWPSGPRPHTCVSIM